VHLITAPRASNPNLHAQDGVFTLYRSDVSEAGGHPDRRDLTEQVMESLGTSSFRKPLFVEFTLSAKLAWDAMVLLSRMGVDSARLFPGYDGVVKCVYEQP
jgi:hypothetical protein